MTTDIRQTEVMTLLDPVNQSLCPDSGDKMVEDLLYFSLPFCEIPLKRMAKTIFDIITETIVVAFSYLGSELLTATGFIFLNMIGDTEGQAALGISQSYNLIFFYGCFIALMDKAGIDLAVSFGAKNYGLTKKTFNQTIYTSLIIFMLLTVPLFLLGEKILGAAHISPEQAKKCQDILSLMIYANFIEMVGKVLQTFCMAQGFEYSFGYVSLIAMALSVASGHYLVVQKGLGVEGWVYSKMIYELIFVVLSLIIFFKTHSKTKGLVSLKTVAFGFWDFFKDSISFMLGSYFEFIGYEIASYFVFISQTQHNIAAYTTIFNFTAMFYAVGETFAVICRTRMNILIGRQLKTAAKNFFLFFICGVALFGILVSGTIYGFRSYIIKAFSDSDLEMKQTFTTLLTAYCFFIPSELTLISTFMGIKTINEIGFLLKLDIALFIITNIILQYILTIRLKLGAAAVFISLGCIFLLENLICITKVALTNWAEKDLGEESIKQNSERMLIDLQSVYEEEDTKIDSI